MRVLIIGSDGNQSHRENYNNHRSKKRWLPQGRRRRQEWRRILLDSAFPPATQRVQPWLVRPKPYWSLGYSISLFLFGDDSGEKFIWILALDVWLRGYVISHCQTINKSVWGDAVRSCSTWRLTRNDSVIINKFCLQLICFIWIWSKWSQHATQWRRPLDRVGETILLDLSDTPALSGRIIGLHLN